MPWLAPRNPPHPPPATPPPSLGPKPPPPRAPGAPVRVAWAAPPHPPSPPTRHAAALAWAQAAAPALNCTAHEMLQAFHSLAPSDPFVDAVHALLDRTPHWSGTAAELLKLLPLCQTPRALSAR